LWTKKSTFPSIQSVDHKQIKKLTKTKMWANVSKTSKICSKTKCLGQFKAMWDCQNLHTIFHSSFTPGRNIIHISKKLDHFTNRELYFQIKMSLAFWNDHNKNGLRCAISRQPRDRSPIVGSSFDPSSIHEIQQLDYLHRSWIVNGSFKEFFRDILDKKWQKMN